MRYRVVVVPTISIVAFVGALIFDGRPSYGAATSFSFSTGDPDGLIATATRPPSAGKVETETADDFVITQQTRLTSATFTGLVVGTGSLDFPRVTVDIYRVFPNESDTTRTINVPTRMNSPGDVELVGRDTASNDMSFTATNLGTFSAANSVLNGIHGLPTPQTGGEGPVTGTEVRVNVNFTTPLDLAPDHYFFRPEVEVSGGEFYWLSAPRPISGAGTTPFTPDLQSWTRNEGLAPDWVRIGTDVVGVPAGGGTAPAFNASFTLTGDVQTQAIPLPGALIPGMATLLGLGVARWRRPKLA